MEPAQRSPEEHGCFDSIDEDVPSTHLERSLRRTVSGAGSSGSDVYSSPSQSGREFGSGGRSTSVFERHAVRKSMEYSRARERYEMNQWGDKDSKDVKIGVRTVIDEDDPALKLSDDANMNQALSRWNQVRNLLSSKSTLTLLIRWMPTPSLNMNN